MVVLYDSHCYRVGCQNDAVVFLENINDLIALNNFQCLTANSCVYFKDLIHSDFHLQNYLKVKRLRNKATGVVNEYKSADPNNSSTILHTYQRDLNYRPSYSFLSIRRACRGQNDQVGQLKPRNEKLLRLYRQYEEQHLRGTPQERFLDYLARLIKPKKP
jgi:hypothetical protein